jgi:hypothetical protein
MKDVTRLKFLLVIFFGILFLSSCEKNKKSGLPTDGDGNEYDTVAIGTQVWLTENLKTTKYNNGNEVRLITDNSEWTQSTLPVYCWYDNNLTTYKNTNGALYNWYAGKLDLLCPVGYHVPTIDEWTTLATYLIDAPKSTKDSFKALSIGWRVWDGSFQLTNSSWWVAAPEQSDKYAWRATQDFSIVAMPKATGYPVRCIKNN